MFQNQQINSWIHTICLSDVNSVFYCIKTYSIAYPYSDDKPQKNESPDKTFSLTSEQEITDLTLHYQGKKY